MSQHSDSLACAFSIAKAKYIQYGNVQDELAVTTTPEDILMELEKYNTLKEDTQALINVVEKLPDNFFKKKTGELKKITFLRMCRKKFGWKKDKLERMARELARI